MSWVFCVIFEFQEYAPGVWYGDHDVWLGVHHYETILWFSVQYYEVVPWYGAQKCASILSLKVNKY